jgi:hypothetical protein
MRRLLESRPAAAFLLACAVAAAFGPLLGAPVFGDDRVFIEGAAVLRLPPGAFLAAVFSRGYLAVTGEGTYQPLVTALHYLTAGHPALSRGAGLLLHWACAVLLLALARRLGAPAKAALGAALLFAVFPTHTETLAVASFQGHVLAALFSLAAVLCWARALETGRPAPAAGAFACFALALLSKETGLLAPALAAVYSLLFARRARPDLQRRAALGAALLGCAYVLWRFRVLDQPALGEPVPSNAAVVLGWYAARLAWPLPLCREHVPPSSPWALGAAAYAAALWAARKRPRALFGLLVAGVGLLPFIDVARHYKDSPVADRFLYLPSAGLALALAEALARTRAAAALAVLGLGWLGACLRRDLQMRDLGALYAQTTRCAPDHPKAWGVLAGYELSRGDYAAAKEHASRAVALGPIFPGAWSVLEAADTALGDEDGARKAAVGRDEAVRALLGEDAPPAR